MPRRGEAPKKAVPRNFLDAARQLRAQLDRDPAGFPALAAQLGIKTRKAYYLAEIDRALEGVSADRERLLRIGWTKLSVLCDCMTVGNAAELLEDAERLTVKQLEARLAGKSAPPVRHHLLLRLSPEQHRYLSSILLAHGATRSSRGLRGVETALMAALDAARKPTEGTGHPDDEGPG